MLQRRSMLVAVFALWCGCGDAPVPAPAAGAGLRIVSLAPSHTELLFALGVGDSVVGRTRFCDRPAAAKAIPSVGDAKSVQLEAIIALQPDLVLTNAEAIVEMLAPIAERVPVRLVRTDTLAQWTDAVRVVGDLVGRPEAAASLTAHLDSVIAKARATARSHARERVLVVVQRSPFFVAGRGSYVHELLDILGYENAAAGLDSAWPSLSAEALVGLAPDAIVDAAPDAGTSGLSEADELRAFWSTFTMVPAVAHDRVRRLTDDVVVRPGPELGYAFEVLSGSIREPGAPESSK